MARYFDITAVTTSIELDESRTGQAAFTVTNATSASIRGDAAVVPEPGAETAKYDIDEPSRRFGPGATEQLTVKVTAPAEMAAGTYGFRLRMLLGGGVPEEQYDDGPTVKYTVAEVKEPPPPPPPPPKPKFQWWIVAVIAVVIAIVVIGIIIFVATRPKPTGTLVVITQVINDNGQSLSPFDFGQHVTSGGAIQASFPSAPFPGVTQTVTAGQYEVTEDPRLFYNVTFSSGCFGQLAAGETRTCNVVNDDFFFFLPPIILDPVVVEPINQ